MSVKSKNLEKLANYILGNGVDISTNNIIFRLKKIAKKGLLTTSLLFVLFTNSSFTKSWSILNNTTQQSIIKKINNDDKSLLIEMGSEFDSGKYELEPKSMKNVINNLNKLKDYIHKNQGFDKSKITNFKIDIISSESNVPNIDFKTKKRLKRGELSKRRADNIEVILNAYLKEHNLYDYVNINKSTVAPIKKWKQGDDKDDYKDEQYVNILIQVEDCPLCGVIANRKVIGQGDITNQFISFNKNYKVNRSYNKNVNINVNTGTIPDRLIVSLDNDVLYDSGFLATDKDTVYKEYKYIPHYILGLTNMYISDEVCINDTELHKVNIIKIDTLEELEKMIMVNGVKPKYTSSKKVKKETLRAMYLLKKLFDNGQREFVFYELEGNNNFVLNLLCIEEGTINVKVYSPLSSTNYDIVSRCH